MRFEKEKKEAAKKIYNELKSRFELSGKVQPIGYEYFDMKIRSIVLDAIQPVLSIDGKTTMIDFNDVFGLIKEFCDDDYVINTIKINDKEYSIFSNDEDFMIPIALNSGKPYLPAWNLDYESVEK